MNKHLKELKDLIDFLTRVDYASPQIREEVKQLLIKSYQEDANGLINAVQAEIDDLDKCIDELLEYL